MPRKDKRFWVPWVAGMSVAVMMLLVGAFVPTQAGAQVTAERVATAKVTEAAKVAATKVLADAKAAAALVVPASQPTTVLVAPPAVVATPPFSVSMLLDWLLKLSGIALAALIPLLLQRWLGGKISADALAAYSKLAVDAVGHSEELAHQALKSGASGLDSNAKANAAVAYVLQAADALKLRPMAEDAVKKLIDAKLGTERTPAMPDAPKVPDIRSDR
jgi:hypothetical protein